MEWESIKGKLSEDEESRKKKWNEMRNRERNLSKKVEGESRKKVEWESWGRKLRESGERN